MKILKFEEVTDEMMPDLDHLEAIHLVAFDMGYLMGNMLEDQGLLLQAEGTYDKEQGIFSIKEPFVFCHSMFQPLDGAKVHDGVIRLAFQGTYAWGWKLTFEDNAEAILVHNDGPRKQAFNHKTGYVTVAPDDTNFRSTVH